MAIEPNPRDRPRSGPMPLAPRTAEGDRGVALTDLRARDPVAIVECGPCERRRGAAAAAAIGAPEALRHDLRAVP